MRESGGRGDEQEDETDFLGYQSLLSDLWFLDANHPGTPPDAQTSDAVVPDSCSSQASGLCLGLALMSALSYLGLMRPHNSLLGRFVDLGYSSYLFKTITSTF